MKDYEIINTVTNALNILYEDKHDARHTKRFLGQYITVTGDAKKDVERLFLTEDWLDTVNREWNTLKIVPPEKDFFYHLIHSLTIRNMKYDSLLKKLCENNAFYYYHGYSFLCDGDGVNMIFPGKKTGKYRKWNDKDKEYWNSLSNKDRKYINNLLYIYVA